jgi:hypothetical protein
MGLAHTDLRAPYILERRRGTLDHSFHLLFTSFIVPSPQQVLELGTDESLYHLSPEARQAVQAGSLPESTTADDLYALGMIVLQAVTLREKHTSLERMLRQAGERQPRVSEVLAHLIGDNATRIRSAKELRTRMELEVQYSSVQHSRYSRYESSSLEHLKTIKDRSPPKRHSRFSK